MALSNGQANAVFTTVHYLTDGTRTREQVIDAFVLLADAAYKTLMAGPNPKEVRELLEKHLP